MSRVRVNSFVVMAAASLSVVSAATAQDSPVGEVFRVDVATGALTPLESSKTVKEKRGGYLYCYLEGAGAQKEDGSCRRTLVLSVYVSPTWMS